MTPFDTLYDAAAGEALPLPPTLAALYGPLAFPVPAQATRPYVISNFVESLDGVVALDAAGKTGGGEISGNNVHDRALMGLLRAVADAVIVGAGTLAAAGRHLWTAEQIYPALAAEYAALRAALGRSGPPLSVFVTARGTIDFGLYTFTSGAVPILIVTTAEGERRLRLRAVPARVRIVALADAGPLSARAVLDAVRDAMRDAVPADTGRDQPNPRILCEGGPRLLADFLAEGCVDELFLTLAPQLAGRDLSVERPGLLEGRLFAPDHPRWATLLSVKRAGSHLFLRYGTRRPDDQSPQGHGA